MCFDRVIALATYALLASSIVTLIASVFEFGNL